MKKYFCSSFKLRGEEGNILFLLTFEYLRDWDFKFAINIATYVKLDLSLLRQIRSQFVDNGKSTFHSFTLVSVKRLK